MDERLVEVLLRVYNDDLEPEEQVSFSFKDKSEYNSFLERVRELKNYDYVGADFEIFESVPNTNDHNQYTVIVTLTERGIAYCKSLKN
jgi:predicted amino acid racemase